VRAIASALKSTSGRVLAAVAVGVVVFLLLFANSLARLYTDWLWFGSLDLTSVWSKILMGKVMLALSFSLVFFIILWVNLVVADRIAPSLQVFGGDDDLIERYQQLVGGHGGKIRIVVAAAFAFVAGVNTSNQWENWLLFRNGEPFGWNEELFDRDAGFYIFELPFKSFVVDWLFATLIVVCIVVVAAHYLNGGIRAAAPSGKVSSGVKVHLSVLLGAVAAVKSAGYYYDRFDLLNSTRGVTNGALATDVNIQLPAYNLLILISGFGVLLFMVNIRLRGWGLPMVAVGLWAISHIFVGNIFPSIYQRVSVVPQVTTRESDFVRRNLEATRFAYGLDSSRLTREELDYKEGISLEEIEEYSDVFENAPIIDPELARDSFVRSQGERAFYWFSDPLDVDRYEIDGKLRPVVLSARGLDLGVDTLDKGWEAQHVLFTHGYGLAMAAGWAADESGRPDFLVRELGDVSVDERLAETLEQPRVYVGEGFHGYAIVNAKRDEIDYQDSANNSVPYRFDGDAGVPMGSMLRRAAFALRFRELDPLIASDVTSESRALFNRDLDHRIRTVAPFLEFDSDPYPVVTDGGIVWVVDAYTTASGFPYSQRVDSDLINSDIAGGYNYIRNSIKAVVDAYTGDVTLYVIDESDPIARAWSSAFPDLFTSKDQIPPSLLDNLRYPTDLFEVQSDMWATYVVSDPVQLIQRDVAWSVAAEPRKEAQETEGDSISMAPQYLVTRLPGSDTTEFVLQRAFVPRGRPGSTAARPRLTGLMVARSDPEHYGELVVYEVPAGQVKALDFVHADIRKNDQMTEFNKEKQGSKVQFGQMSLLMIDDTIVYIRPVYVESPGQTAVPELSRVVAVSGDRIGMDTTLAGALAAIAEDGPGEPQDPDSDIQPEPEPEPEPEPDTGSTGTEIDIEDDLSGRSVIEIVDFAEELLRQADLAEQSGQDAEADRLRDQAKQAIQEVARILGGDRSPQPADSQSTGT